MGHSRPLFLYFRLFETVNSKYCSLKIADESNRGSLVLETSVLPTSVLKQLFWFYVLLVLKEIKIFATKGNNEIFWQNSNWWPHCYMYNWNYTNPQVLGCYSPSPFKGPYYSYNLILSTNFVISTVLGAMYINISWIFLSFLNERVKYLAINFAFFAARKRRKMVIINLRNIRYSSSGDPDCKTVFVILSYITST